MRQLKGAEEKVWEDSAERRCVSLTADGLMLSELASTKCVRPPLVSSAAGERARW